MGKKKQAQQQQDQQQQQQDQQQQQQDQQQQGQAQGQQQQVDQNAVNIPADPQQQPDQQNPIYQGSAGGQTVGGQTAGGLEQPITSNSSGGSNDASQYLSNNRDSTSPLERTIGKDEKSNVIIIVFGGVISLYIIVSAIIYIASFVVKNKEDDLTEDFYKEITKEKKDNNQFFMDPALHKSPVIKAATENEEGTFQKMDNKDDYDHIWDNYIVTGKTDDIEIDVNKRKEYPSTPITPISPSPLQQSFTNESYNVATRNNSDVAQKRNIGHRESNSTSSSTASVSNLIPKNQKKANEAYNNEPSPPTPAHHQFPNGRPNGPQIKFTMDQKSDSRGPLSPPVHQGSHSNSPRSPRPTPNVERQGSQGNSRPQLPPIQRGPERQGSQGSPRPGTPNQRGPERQGSQGSPRLPQPRNVNPDRQGSQNSPRLPPPRNGNPERQGSQGSPRPPQPRNVNPDRQGSQNSPRLPPPRNGNPERQGSQASLGGGRRPSPPRNPNLDRQGSNGNMRPQNNSRPQPRH
ncbi:hypothetical protein PIROE2DRAFT_58916 [Piromyces sp. E2]|nr:hypothetical protein PIROE2DRAFT_58916 [Piromyces sp. E2]|eukprot:OUM67232.1 hypothetical protein PIROE2DRAFT_58916 [Piromyces sp. E2]